MNKEDCACSQSTVAFVVDFLFKLQSDKSLVPLRLHWFHCSDLCLRDRLGRTALHLAITSWPRVLTSEPHSKMKNIINGRRLQAAGCLRLLCEHGVNINAAVRHFSRSRSVAGLLFVAGYQMKHFWYRSVKCFPPVVSP